MAKKIMISTLVLVAVFALIMTGLSLSKKTVMAAENSAKSMQVDSGEKTERGFGFGRGMHGMMRNAEDLDGDDFPDMPEGVSPRWHRDRVRDPESDSEGLGQGRGMGMHGMMHSAKGEDGDGFPDLPDGVTPRWHRDRVRDPEAAGEGFGKGRGMGKDACPFATETEAP